MKLFRLCFLTTILLSLIACSEPEKQVKEDPIRPVKLFNIGHDSQINIRSFPAEVVANQGSYLAFRVNGELVKFPVLAGEHVEKGDLLAKLDPEDFQLQYDERKARFELAKSQLGRIEQLFEKKITSQSELDQATANMQIAESAFKIAQTNLEYSELRAPFSGTVAKVFVKNFENIQAKQNILRLETRDLMDVEIQVPEKIVARFKKGTNYQPTVKFDGYDDKEYTLTIKEWDTQANPATLTYKVVFSLPVPKDFNLLAGMTGRVLIDLSKVTRSQVAYTILPIESVFSEPQESTKDNAYVWLFDSATGEVHKQAVKIGQLHRDGIEVLSGIEEGQIVVSAGVHSLKEGMKVRAWNKERGL
ncbi:MULTISPECIES: efflux RND transporter periplasmic adaptor subunit [unclassified Pseudoalteromonas]|jgi:RND family efflux transporter MFP subunit|uniref:efflux RND transporter periplasmic adaptor subunit n=1 Tax=unclassified Pseudoalteromonas TaxID=194690 RepID=UPI00110A926A|nr:MULTISPECIES: efflux RND transporter periplasmic adaptor subunit [unclassified Pseudoalteromonas]MBB1384958.1 efflux RND transporter periplasmic adaptor subunit [Pseudoalteromonas sp. SG45-5]MBB1392872.1 efflux RND transporter periplasmic adaptor subunit [Pseudoalteromonas sp. SG44-4]MBB1446163.1 efflux RND transporter periplasmic adaptor subunit [Pseudoalteromonas sp. SG41-6]TMN94291.1 efflux RND transporter periplasmic adaptor subunit [Pseudoalteromonas sp. S558]